jgi:hypothetical protein
MKVVITDSRRIRFLTSRHLQRIRADVSGWTILYRDPDDGRYWELTYPQSEMHGGGPPQLRWLSKRDALKKYRLGTE